MQINKHAVKIFFLSLAVLSYGAAAHLMGQYQDDLSECIEARRIPYGEQGAAIEVLLFGDTFVSDAKLAGAMVGDLPRWASLSGCDRLAGYLQYLGKVASDVVATVHPVTGNLPLDIARTIGCKVCVELLENLLKEEEAVS